MFWTSGEDEPHDKPDDGAKESSEEELAYELELSLCEEIDWSVLDSLYDYTDDSWKDELSEASGQSDLDPDKLQGFRNVSCNTSFPVEGIDEDLQTTFLVQAWTFYDEKDAKESFDTEPSRDSDSEEGFREQEMDEIPACDKQRRDARYDEDHLDKDPDVQLILTCSTDNMVVGTKLNGHRLSNEDIDELDPIADDIMAPIITDALNATKND